MIQGITPPSGPEFRRANAVERGAPAQKPGSVARDAEPFSAASADMAAAGAPIDHAKVARVRAAIADGSYRIDPDAVAGAMIALDLDA